MPQLRFIDYGDEHQKIVSIVQSVNNNDLIGEIRWWHSQERYLYLPDNETVYNEDCLGEIAEKLRQLNSEEKDSGTEGKGTSNEGA